MANIRIPDKLENKLRQGDQQFYGIVLTTLGAFGEILQDNKLFFFEEYTDHGIRHIDSVLLSSLHLTTDDTLDKILNAADIGCYILAVTLHDIAMHLDAGGFIRLIAGEFDHARIPEFDKQTWAAEWAGYLDEARKFDDKQLEAIFGGTDIIIHPPDLSEPAALTQSDRKLIGEFIRRHHPRLAHEIAVAGFPGGKANLAFAAGLDRNLRDLIGLIARSHGITLRACIVHIEDNYGKNNKRHPMGVHAIYLMVLLRIADYIQIDSTRVSNTLLRLKRFASPYSEAEHNLHQSVEHIDMRYQNDPERIYVTARPKDSIAYLKLQRLIRDIQQELDTSWAVLGEHYGHFDHLEIKYRRITSNLDDEAFIARQNYIPDHFAFKASESIIRLLIAPLYGDDPSFGVRELLQNAVDACREQKDLQPDHQPYIKVEVTQAAENEYYFTITDNGVGMSPVVIRDYFLNAGASYRRSAAWQKAFTDEAGRSRVNRNGRFGIGLLAAFLIGKHIEVTTRKRDEEHGYSFSADLQSSQINIEKDPGVAPGTRIRIKFDQDVYEEFFDAYQAGPAAKIRNPIHVQWSQWFVLAKPTIEYFHLGEKLPGHPQPDPDWDEQLPNDWQAIDYPGYRKIYWTYSDQYVNIPFHCNGFIIPVMKKDSSLQLPYSCKMPNLAVFDFEGTLPLTLDRKGFASYPPFKRELVKDIFKDYLARVLTVRNITQPEDHRVTILAPRLNYTDDSDHNEDPILDFLLMSKKGYLINASYCLEKTGPIDVLLLQSEQLGQKGPTLDLDIEDAFLLLKNTRVNSVDDYSAAITIDANDAYFADDDWEFDLYEQAGSSARSGDEESNSDNEPEDEATLAQRIEQTHIRVFMKKAKYDHLFKSDKKRGRAWVRKRHQVESSHGEWICFAVGNPRASGISKSFLEKYESTINFIREYRQRTSINVGILNELLQNYLGEDVLIPYDLEERKRKFPKAFKELERYMRKYL